MPKPVTWWLLGLDQKTFGAEETMAVRKKTLQTGVRAKRSRREIALHADRILKVAAERAKSGEAKGLSTVILPRAELIKKLSRRSAHSPFLTHIGWGLAVRGSNFPLSFGVMNPDPWPYSDGNLGLCIYWGPAGGITEPGLSMLNADKPPGVLAVTIGYLNASPTPYDLSADHIIPLTARGGRNDLSYLLYSTDSWQAGTLLERGSIDVIVA
ncbi:MAG: hypothetical protein H7Z74_12105 [Anaerolineae bacterium]|nr:hypothetical protein [Gemmatimonadaceae bacterium]